MSRLALVLGRSPRNIVNILIQAIILVVVSLPFGLSISLEGC